ncbi:MAG: Holliday junction branch migration protein RuvA [Acidobacteria bacterium]|nr:Holliday junction branch migration protein RuvA [Acidobacteriota bacterium]MCI0568158.1 Holliday junction branch migration protein RuvA [Acidobacteriota bacterium]
MIARLAGILLEKSTERIIVDVQGVGYEVRVPLSTYCVLPATGESVHILVHTHVREDSLSLYGFSTPRERHLFEKMISVSGVGPKLALALLSGLSPEELASAILSGNTQPLGRVPGVGRKTAERLVVDLRDKLGAAALGTELPEGTPGGRLRRESGEGALVADVHSALLNLGYSAREAERALDEARRGAGGAGATQENRITFEGLLREALRNASAMR